MKQMYPLKMNPEIKYLLWGGTRLKEVYQKPCTREDAGESWEVSTHPAGQSTIANGFLSGATLADAIAQYPGQIAPADFPFLFKLIDANQDLSIQVHPDDAYAQKNENSPRGKTEMWYIIDAKPNARIGYGWKKDMTKDQVRTAAQNGTLEHYIRYVPVSAGQSYFIPAGTVHCLCDGLLVAEIQQNSNVTYRLYDYNRKDAEGKSRPLHIEKSLDVANLNSAEDAKPVVGDNVTLVSCPYFTAQKMTGREYHGDTKGQFELLFFISGQGEIITKEGREPFQGGDTFVIPCSLGAYTVQGQYSIMRCVE